jgi:hypothetical protein
VVLEQDIYIKQIPSDDPLLGRNIEHDPRSRAYAFRAGRDPLASIQHHSNIRTLNQHVGSCTCHTALKLCTYSHWFTLSREQQGAIIADPDGMATDWYRETTRNDEFDGEWEPNDTGSSGTSASKTAVRRGFAKGFQHAFSFDDTLAMLAKKPVGIGVWWYSTFDRPDHTGLVRLTSASRRRGGHEFVLDELDVEHEQVWAQNSWGDDFGIAGRFRFSFADLERLLNEDGDSVQLLPLDEPAPEPNWDLMLAKPLRNWAYSRPNWSTKTKSGQAATAAKDWLTRKGL